jgi:hypothetical protein
LRFFADYSSVKENTAKKAENADYFAPYLWENSISSTFHVSIERIHEKKTFSSGKCLILKILQPTAPSASKIYYRICDNVLNKTDLLNTSYN